MFPRPQDMGLWHERNVDVARRADLRANSVSRIPSRGSCRAIPVARHGVKQRFYSGERNGDVTIGLPSPECGQIK